MLQIQAGECEWGSTVDCGIWRRILWVSLPAVAIDLLLSTISMMTTTALKAHRDNTRVFRCERQHPVLRGTSCRRHCRHAASIAMNGMGPLEMRWWCRASLAMHVVALLCELEILAATLALTLNSKNSTPSTFLFLCASLFVTILSFSATVLRIGTMLQPLIQVGRRVAVSVAGSAASVRRRRSSCAAVSVAVDPDEAEAVQSLAGNVRRSSGASIGPLSVAPWASGKIFPAS